MKMIKNVVAGLTLLWACALWAGQIDINTADTQALTEGLSGIGMKKAQAIVDYRTANGPFKSIDDLVNVKGISDKTVAKNRDNIAIGKN
jgi:competence protein ComEA